MDLRQAERRWNLCATPLAPRPFFNPQEAHPAGGWVSQGPFASRRLPPRHKKVLHIYSSNKIIHHIYNIYSSIKIRTTRSKMGKNLRAEQLRVSCNEIREISCSAGTPLRRWRHRIPRPCSRLSIVSIECLQSQSVLHARSQEPPDLKIARVVGGQKAMPHGKLDHHESRVGLPSVRIGANGRDHF